LILEYWGQVSKEAKGLISGLLTVNPAKRLSADGALKHDWITQSDDYLVSQDLGVNLDQFKKFNAKRKFKAAVKTIIITRKLASLGVDFKKNLQ
jgi:serine/threonine protein kinase